MNSSFCIDGLRQDVVNYANRTPEADRVTSGILALIEQAGMKCLERDCSDGKITGSIIVANPEDEEFLFMHHARFDRWQQFGGHYEHGDASLADAAKREFCEEAGYKGSIQTYPQIINIQPYGDTRSDGSRVQTYDVEYLGVLPEKIPESNFVCEPGKVKGIKWISRKDYPRYNSEEKCMFILNRAHAYYQEIMG